MRVLNSKSIPNVLLFEHALGFLQQGKSIIIIIKGESMRPFLREGDKVLLKPIGGGTLLKGMVVLAKRNQNMVLHRVVKMDDTNVWLAGDGNLVKNEIVNRLDVVAVADQIRRADRKIDLNKKWRYVLGMIWYRARTIRRIFGKLLKNKI